ncbi:unnamed protein product [Fraxinus pennsylvanica]|uniref:Uncharacterized protein n=1 Tax=Fraxinus pennsylvanica TaxID=56036 RepID=A0AAD1ZUC6_9LAMI|nr:unnamed protein product [Fraxinus pennsylvanica]
MLALLSPKLAYSSLVPLLNLNHNIHGKHLLNVASRDREIYPSQVQEKEDLEEEAPKVNVIQDQIEYIREMLDAIGDGRTNVSPYESMTQPGLLLFQLLINGDDMPQLPHSLRWIPDHQLPTVHGVTSSYS